MIPERGDISPLFYYYMVNLEERIEKLVEEILPDDSLYLVEVEVKGSKQQPRVVITVDGDEGVNIDTCAMISRKLGNEIEAEELIDTRYNLEVTSPGADQPLKLRRQFRKNLGRKLNLELEEGLTITGKLLDVGEDSLKIAAETLAKNGKNKKIEEQEVPFDEIKLANVIISFK